MSRSNNKKMQSSLHNLIIKLQSWQPPIQVTIAPNFYASCVNGSLQVCVRFSP